MANSILNEQSEEDIRRELSYYSTDATINQAFDQEHGLFVTSLIPVKLEPDDNPALISELVREELKGGFEVSCDIDVKPRYYYRRPDDKSRMRNRTRPPPPPPLLVQVGYTISNECGLNAVDIMNGTETNLKE
eukprot:816820_1